MSAPSPRLVAVLLMALSAVAACDRPDPARPEPQTLTRDAIGYYCNMTVIDHGGPKAQIFLQFQDQPNWFTSVRDAVAFTMLPEEPKDIAAIYVTDMASTDWDSPAAGVWIDARAAWYVIGSARMGGMGAPEAVPFSDKAAAENLVATSGGVLVRFDEIPEDFVLGGVRSSGERLMPDGAAGRSSDDGSDRGEDEP